MAEQAIECSRSGLHRVPFVVGDNGDTISGYYGGVVDRIVCTASSSGTIAIADGQGTVIATLSLTAGTVYELNIPFSGTLTLTLGGTTATGILVLRDS